MEAILTLKQLAQACGGTVADCDENLIVTDIVTDSRKLSKGALFVALRGERFDGHNFAAQALASGAVCCVTDKGFAAPEGLARIEVDDTYAALRAMAELYRSRFLVSVVGITGSVGKTSTKDMVASVLKKRCPVLKTEGNFNNEIGVPLTVFRLSKQDEIAVFEMGMSAFGEISRLTKIVSPDVAILTNIGYSHIEHLGSRENILKAKLEILEGLTPNGTVILNGDDPYLSKAAESIPAETLCYGIENQDCDIVAANIRKYPDKTVFEVDVEGSLFKVTINVAGLHHVYNALAAILTGIIYNMPMEDIIEGIAEFRPFGMRQKTELLEELVLIRDCYNASPASMKSGLEVLSVTHPKDKTKPTRRVAVLGDMLELGDFAEQAHRDVGKLCSDYGVDCLIAVGQNAEFVAKGAIEHGFKSSELYVFYDNNAAKAHITDILKPNDIVLFKGSRGMRLEEIADFVAENNLKAD